MVRRLLSQFFALALLTCAWPCSVYAQGLCWDIDSVSCSTIYPDQYCSDTACVNDVCPQGTVEYESTPNGYDIGISTQYGFDGTVPGTNFVYCIRQRDCNSGCGIYSGESKCQNGAADLFNDPNATNGAKEYDEVGSGYGCGYL